MSMIQETLSSATPTDPVSLYKMKSLSSRLILLLSFASIIARGSSFCGNHHHPLTFSWPKPTFLSATKGFGGGGGGFGAKSKPSKQKKISKTVALKRVQKKYGGTSAQEIAQGTQRQIEGAMKALPPHLKLATELYQQLQKWNTRIADMSILQQANLPPQEVQGAQRAQNELDRIYAEHNLTEMDLHNVFQKITWDASADAKAARSMAGEMPGHLADRVQRACNTVAQNGGRCLDVGCGYGVLVPFLKKAGLSPSQIVGLDLSDEMVRNAGELHPGVEFVATDFFQYEPSDLFDGIVFCASLHDMPDMKGSLEKALSILKPEGILVVAHPQGAAHVRNQARSNPILVKRELPSGTELQQFNLDASIVSQPAAPNSAEDNAEGYFVVLKKSS